MKQLKLIVLDQIGHIKENPINTGTLRTWLLLYIWDSDPRLRLDLSKKERKEIVYVCFLCIAKLRYGNREAVTWSYCSKRETGMNAHSGNLRAWRELYRLSRTWRGWSHLSKCHLFILSEWDLWSSFPYFSFLTKKKMTENASVWPSWEDISKGGNGTSLLWWLWQIPVWECIMPIQPKLRGTFWW